MTFIINFNIYIVLLIAVTLILILIINFLKNDSEYPIIFKILLYTIIFIINIISMIIILFIHDKLINKIIFSYIIITFILFIMYFLVDEDNIWRFEKYLSFFLIIILNVIFYTIWYKIIM